MFKLIVIDREGQERSVKATVGSSVMEIIRDNGCDQLVALCGGCCSCATCHVHVEPRFLAQLPPLSDNEHDLLDGSLYRNATSRLSCQIPFAPELDGLRVQIAEED
jgi:2Fe-2S ferredoxin